MATPTLVIGNKNYSSWSLRPWLLMRHAGAHFTEVRIPLYRPESKSEILRYSPAGKVPVLVDGPATVWESIAICQYVAERIPGLWPDDPVARAAAWSVSAEMHAGFAQLRANLPMNIRRHYKARTWPAEVEADVARVVAIWHDCRDRFGAGGDFLFGRFSVADAMFAPVATRFRTYSVELPPVAQAWADAVLALPAFREWERAAEAETEVIQESER